MKVLRLSFAVFFLMCTFLTVYVQTLAQTSPVSAEAVGQANLRAAADVNSTVIGQIVSGTRYPVIGRSEFYPWLLLADPATQQPLGWVFDELLNVQGNANSVPVSDLVLGAAPPYRRQRSWRRMRRRLRDRMCHSTRQQLCPP